VPGVPWSCPDESGCAMATTLILRRVLAAGGLAIATVAAPTLFALSAPAATSLQLTTNCPPGMTADRISGSCFQGGDDAAPGPVVVPPSPLGSIDGIPCTGHNSGECIGLGENTAPQVQPHSSVGSSP
jgi:hypothetical protein